jgi:hypothetical protein
MTRNLKLFTIFSIVWPLPFLLVLHWALYDLDKRGPVLFVSSIILGIGFSIAGKQLGKRDDQSKVRYNLAARYILVSSLIPTLEVILLIIGWQKDQSWRLYPAIASILFTFLIIYLFSRNSIKGMRKGKLFQ